MTGSTARLGVLALALGALTLVPRASRAYEVKRSADGSLVRWAEARVSFSVKPEVLELRGAENAVGKAIAAWSGRGGGPEIALGRKANAGAAPGADGRNTIFYAKDGYAPAGNALAITILSYDEQTGRILDADIVLNGKFKLGRIGIGDDTDEYDVNRVVAHEMGHALGLSDEPAREDALMFPYVAPSAVLLSAPARDDVAGLATLYESKASEDASSETSVGCGANAVARAVDASTSASTRSLYVHDEAAPSKATDAVALVTAARTSTVDGLLQTELELTTTSCSVDCPPALRVTMWGGTENGIRQEISGVAVPRAGERVALGLGRQVASRAFYRDPVAKPSSVAVYAIERLGR